MNKYIYVFLFLVSIAQAQEPPNIHFTKQKLTFYYRSGEYHRDFERGITKAKNCLIKHIKNNGSKGRRAIILDIDDTALAFINYNNELTFGVSHEVFKAIARKANEPALLATLNLYNFAKSQGIAVFFVSGRTEELREATIKNLKKVGYKDWDGLYLRPVDYYNKTAVQFKMGVRKILRAKGYNIIGNIGDQKSDLIGDDDAGCKVKLPNPYYFVL